MPVKRLHDQTFKNQQATLFQQGDEKALAFFYSEFYAALVFYVFGFIGNKSTAEEIAADSLVKTWRMHEKLDNFYKIRAYLYKTAKNDCLTILQKAKRSKNSAPDISLYSSDDNPFERLVKSEVSRILHSALKNIPPAARKVIVMHYLDGKTTGQIASELKLHPSTIKTQKKTGLTALRKKLSLTLPGLVLISLKILLQGL